MLLGRTAAAAAAAAGTATNAVVIRVREVSSGEVQQEMRRWQWAYGEKRLSPFCAHSVVSGRPQTSAVPSSDNHTSLDWSGLNHQ